MPMILKLLTRCPNSAKVMPATLIISLDSCGLSRSVRPTNITAYQFSAWGALTALQPCLGNLTQRQLQNRSGIFLLEWSLFRCPTWSTFRNRLYRWELNPVDSTSRIWKDNVLSIWRERTAEAEAKCKSCISPLSHQQFVFINRGAWIHRSERSSLKIDD